MAKRDWLTGQSLEREGPNPIAGFLAGLMQAQAGKQQQADAERRGQQKIAMMRIQDGRTMLEKAAQMDPALWGDTGFMSAWQAGQVDYLANKGCSNIIFGLRRCDMFASRDDFSINKADFPCGLFFCGEFPQPINDGRNIFY